MNHSPLKLGLILRLALIASSSTALASCKDSGESSKDSAATQKQAPSENAKRQERAADFKGSVATLLEGQPVECLDLLFWGEEPLRDFEIEAWREALLPKNDPTTLNLKDSCGVTYRAKSPRAVCLGTNEFQKDGLNYKVSMTTTHYLEVDLGVRAQECRARAGRWLKF